VLDDCSEQAEPALPGAVCGDGVVSGEEACDDGEDNATYEHCGGRCDGPHLYCGDARRDPPEQCDDGNDEDDDGCDRRCRGIDLAAPSDEDGGAAGWQGVPPWQQTGGTGPGGTAGTGPSSGARTRVDGGPGADEPKGQGCDCRALGTQGTRGSGAHAQLLAAALSIAWVLRRPRRQRRQRQTA
jgi:cysteine-rich repeat protein